MTRFPHLFSEITIGDCKIANRIVSTGHHTYMADGVPSERLVAYHAARARGGAGLIVSEIVAVHATAGFSQQLLRADSRDIIPAYKRLTEACQAYGTRIFAQLFHPGREVIASRDGMMPIAWAPSSVPNERFHIMPKALPRDLIEDIITAYGQAAALLAEAGFDGFEIVASHGYLPAQFLNPQVNRRDDAYGGDFTRRLTFLKRVIDSVRGQVQGRAVGVRLSGSERDPDGLDEAQTTDIAAAIAAKVDYLSIVAGTSASLGGSVHVVPPMGLSHAYVAPTAARIKQRVDIPVIVAGRINQPQVAEGVIAEGQADLCGMTRALICDPQMPDKARAGRLDDIRACIGCNQACIGRAHKSLPISCIQHPESGREIEFGALVAVRQPKRVMVVGGGPAGMKAAAVAAARGHQVVLHEASGQLGGQARLAQQLPGREEFGGIITNLGREMARAGVEVVRRATVSAELVLRNGPDAVILATGARAYLPDHLEITDAHAVTAWEVLQNQANLGASVVIADWRADWIGVGLAERLARQGCKVTLCTNAAMAGETLQLYTRNHYVGRLHKLGVSIRTHLRLFGADQDTAYFVDTLTGDPVEVREIDTVVLSLGHLADDHLQRELARRDIEVLAIGDCVAPRSAEEAVYEGLQAGRGI